MTSALTELATSSPHHVPDLVGTATRARWARQGWYPDEDLYTLFTRQVARDPDRDAVVDEDGPLTYGQLDHQVRRLAVGLRALGLHTGDVLGIQLPNSWLGCALELATAAIGAVALPYPVGRGERDVLSLLRRSAARATVTATDHRGHPSARHTLALAGQLPELRAVVAVGDTPPAGSVPIPLLLAGDDGHFRPSWPEPNSAARIIVSSGSEAEPKMVAYSHNILAGGRGRVFARFRGPGADFRVLFLPPLASAFGGYATAGALCATGATLILQPRFTPLDAWRAARDHRATHLIGVPTMLRKMLDNPDRPHPDLPDLRAVVLGGSALDRQTAGQIQDRLDCTVINLYGSADGVISHSSFDDPPERATSAGRPDPEICEIRLVDENLTPVAPGQVGEITGLGPVTPMSYLGAPELDARYRLPGGWVRTGDLGRIDKDGYLTIVGRRKDIVIRGGLNISPAEIETLLLSHPAVTDAACIAVPDPVYGERLCACTAGTGPLTLAEIGDFLRSRGLEPRKLPELHLPLPALPIGPSGKIDRLALRTLASTRPVEPPASGG